MSQPKVFLVTGAGRDLGRAVSDSLGGPGCFAILHYAASAEGAQTALECLREQGGDGVAIKADFSDAAAVSRFLAEAENALAGRKLNAIVLNAAATAATPLGGASVEMLQAMLTVNVLAPQRLMDALAPQIADGGTLIALSIAAVRQVFAPEFSFFCATKAAVDVLVKGWAVALGPRGIRVNAVAPGVIDVNFRAELLKNPAFRAALESVTALGRPAQMGDIVDVVSFLASDQARWITGQVIDASGGWKL